MKEIFRDVLGYEGLYQVSNHGRVKSLARKGCKKDRMLKSLVHSSGYYVVALCNGKRKISLIHQLEAIAFLNHKPCGHKLVIDHIDHNKLNNYLPNLRVITHRENTNKKHLKSSSQYVGVNWDKDRKKWRALIHINNKIKHLGLFTDELEASKAYQFALNNL